GRLGKAPRQIQTQTGTTMAAASVAVTVPLSRGDDTDTQWFDILAFGRTAEQLLRHQAGDMVNVFGSVQINRWQSNGETKQNLQIVAESLLSARTTRPGKRKASNQSAPQPEFDDALNF
ncbi:MAG: single-stranded DNA-binding protein, partial [Candidatus Competibacteraceae bacterium]|nr:single-stranded DNA-binding protein [Candidatus Competibacteraceae bacterium]